MRHIQLPDSINFDENQGLARIDYHLSNQNTIFGRYFITNWEQQPAKPESAERSARSFYRGHRWRFQPSPESHSRGHLSDRIEHGQQRSRDSKSKQKPHRPEFHSRSCGLACGGGSRSREPLLPNQIGEIYQLGTEQVSKLHGGFRVTGGFFGLFDSTPSLQPYDTLEAADDLSLTRGAHQISFGVDYHQPESLRHNYLLNQGQFTFDGNRLDVLPFPLASSGLADYMMGLTSAKTGFAQDAPIPSIQHQNIFSIYAQDAWKITRGLTITAGLRWDPFFGHTDPTGHVVNISLPNIINDVHSTKFPAAPAGYLFQGDPGGPSNNKLSKNALNKWSPRLGSRLGSEGRRSDVHSGRVRDLLRLSEFLLRSIRIRRALWRGRPQPPVAVVPSRALAIRGEQRRLRPTTSLFAPTPARTSRHSPCLAIPSVGDRAVPMTLSERVRRTSAYLPGALVFSYPQMSSRRTSCNTT